MRIVKIVRQLLVLSIFLNAVSEAQVPTITSFSPTSGSIGTSVTIIGTNFNSMLANNIVYFGAVNAAVNAASSTSLTVSVPVGATFAPISVTDTTTGLTAYSNAPFLVTFPSARSIGATSFATKVDFGTVSPTYGITIGDIDGDGKSDLVAANQSSNSISVFRNTSISGSITTSSLAAQVDFTTGANPYFVAIGDLDGDGKPDLVTVNALANSISIFRNTSTSGSITAGSFASKADFTTGASPYSVAICDVDEDGKPDIVTTNSGSNTVSVFRNTSTSGSITASSFAPKIDFAAGTAAGGVAIGDVDGDGKPDLVVANPSDNTVSVFRNTSTFGSITTSSFAAKVDFTTGATPYIVAIGDVDGDGRPDLIAANSGGGSGNTVSVFRNTSTPGSITAGSFAAKVDFITGTNPLGVAIGDLDGDGKPDLVVANANTNTVSVFRNTNTSGSITTSSFAAKVDFTTGATPWIVVIGDVDGDGKPDIVAANYGSNTVSVFRNTIAAASLPITPTLVSPANSATNQPTTLTVRWNVSQGATSYRVQVAADSNFVTDIAVDDSTVTDTSKAVNILANATTYYWCVNAKNSGGTSSYSGTRHFATIPAASGNSISFNGTTACVTVADSASLRITGSMTLESWVRREVGGSGSPRIIDKARYALYFDGTGLWQKVVFQFPIIGGAPAVVSNQYLRAGVWYHIAGVYDGSQMKLYINGMLDNVYAWSNGSWMDNAVLEMGRNASGATDYLKGRLDEARVWNVARDSNEINYGMVHTLAGNETGLVAYYRMDEQNGTTTYDASPSVNNGTLNGGAQFVLSRAFPPPPRNVAAQPANGSVTLRWLPTIASTAMQYRVYRSTASVARQMVTTLNLGTNAYIDSPPANDTIYFYQMTTVDSSSSEGDYSLTATATPHANLAGNAIVLDGTSGYVNVSDDLSLRITGSMTLESWVRREVGGGGSPRIIDKARYALYFDGTGLWQKVIFQFPIIGGAPAVTSNQYLRAGVWYHVAGVYDGSQMKLYINGVLDNTSDWASGSWMDNAVLTMGRNASGATDHLKGQLDEARVWNVARDSNQINYGMVHSLAGNETGLVAYYRMDEQNGTTTYDASASVNNGTLNGGTSFARSGVTPYRPTNLAASSVQKKVNLTWTASASPNTARYKIYRRFYLDNSFSSRDSVLSGTTTFTDSVNLTSGYIYFYTVTAVDSNYFESDTSNNVTATISGGTPVLADINANTTWLKSGSPYRVINNIAVASGATLTVQPGVIVQLDLGVAITINGVLKAIGTSVDSIRFTTLQAAPAPSQWQYLLFNNASLPASELRYCVVEFGGSSNNPAISSSTSGIQLEISNSLIWKNCNGIYLPGVSADSISFTTVSQNTNAGVTAGGAVIMYGDSVVQNGSYGINSGGPVKACRVGSNAGFGIYSTASVAVCDVYNNGGYGINSAFIRGNTIRSNAQAGAVLLGSATADSNLIFLNSGGGISGTSGVAVRRNAIYRNSGSSGIFGIGANSTVENNTVVKNAGGITDISSSSGVLVRNNIVAFNNGNGVHTTVSPAPTTKFNNVFLNTTNYSGYSPTFGNLISTNRLGDPADAFSNVSLDPQFTDTSTSDYHPKTISHMIDSGDTLSVKDPDSSIADLGVFFYNHAAGITTSSISLVYGSVIIGDSLGRSFRIYSNGNSNLVVSNITSTSSEFLASPKSFTLAPNDSQQVTLIFSPHWHGQRNAAITIVNNSSTNPNQVLSAVGSGIDTVAPSAPAGLVAIQANKQVNLAWSANTESDILRYRVLRNTTPPANSVIDSVVASRTTYADTGIIYGSTFFYRIVAVDSSLNQSPFSGQVSVTPKTPPPTPQSLIAAVGNAQIFLKWNKVSFANLKLYRIYSGTSSPAATLSDSTGTGKLNDTSRTINGLTNGSKYYFRVTAMDSAGIESGYSNEANATPADRIPPSTPQNLTITDSSSTTITIKWRKNTESDFLRYRVYRNTSPNPIARVDSTTGGIADTSRTFTALTNGTRYYFRITAIDSSFNESGYSNEVNATPVDRNAPSAPQALAVTDSSSTTITIKWRKNTEPDFQRYRIYRGTSPNPVVKFDSTTTSIADTSRTFTGLTNGTRYYFRVTAVDSSGNESPYSNEVNAVPGDRIAPSSPTGTTINSAAWTNTSGFTIAWTGPSDPSGIAAVWYQDDTAPTSGAPGTRVVISGTSLQRTITTVGKIRIYFYLEDGAGNKDPNTAVSVAAKFDNIPPQILHDSTSVGTVTISSTGSVSGSAIINATSSDSGSGIRSFLIQYKRFSDAGWTTGTGTSVTIPNSFFLPFLMTPTGVEYQLVASDSANNVTVRNYTIVPAVQQLSVVLNSSTAATASGVVGAHLTNYRMFSVPFLLGNKTPRTVLFDGGLGSPEGVHTHSNWRLQSLNASGNFDDYETGGNSGGFSSSEFFNLGAALMLIVRDPGKTITVTATGIADARQMFEQGIPLNAGWNLVGDPFPFAVPTDSLVMSNSAQNSIQFAYYSGTGSTNGWTVSTGPSAGISLKPWEGLAIKPAVAGNLLFKNGLPSSSVAPSTGLTAAKDASEIIKTSKGQSWAMTIDATRYDGGLNDRGLLIGMVDQVSQPASSLGWSHPPFFGDKVVSVYFEVGTDHLMRDFRQLSDSGGTWEMKVRTGDRAARVNLSIEGASTISNSQWKAFLIDVDERMAYDLRDRSSIDINSGNGLRNFRVVVGTKSFVKQNSAGVDLFPTSFKLYPNYPNPFNPETVIRYTVPDNQPTYKVSIKVYDILGREVATVVEADQKSGYYEVRFGIRNLSSGVYLCRMSVTDANRHSAYQHVIKMLMMK